MIFENQQITRRQFGCLLVMDWLVKALLLLPGAAGQKTGIVRFWWFGAELLLALLFGWLVGRVAGWVAGSGAGKGSGVAERGYASIRERFGGLFAWGFTFLYLIYVFFNTLFLVRLFGNIAVTYVLPEAPVNILMGMLLLLGLYLAGSGLEARARVSGILCRLLVCFFFIVLAGIIWKIVRSGAEGGTMLSALFEKDAGSDQLPENGRRFLAIFGGMGLSLYVAPSVKEPEKMGRTIAGAVLVTGIFTGLFLLVSLFAFGEAGLRTLDWPVITLMSSALLPGGFFQRWDAIFTSLLLAGILPGVGAGIFYLGILSKNLFFRKVSYRKLCGVVAVLLLMVCLLTGCAGRELEDRAFPTVLAAEDDTFLEQLEKYQKESARLVDYSHVKAILFSKEAITDEKIRDEILKFLEADPAFARNILIYIGDEEALSLARGAEEETILSGIGETSKEDLGLYLEDLANTQEESLTLGGLLYGIHNGGISLEIPGLQVQDGILVPGKSFNCSEGQTTDRLQAG